MSVYHGFCNLIAWKNWLITLVFLYRNLQSGEITASSIYTKILICVPLQYIYWNFILRQIVLGDAASDKWLNHESEALNHVINSFIEEALESCFVPFTIGSGRYIALWRTASTQTPNPPASSSRLLELQEIHFCH